MKQVRRSLALTLAIGAALAIGVAAIAIADKTPYQSSCFRSTVDQGSDCPGHLIFKFGGEVTPTALPKHKMAPVAVRLHGKVSTENGGQPSALREATIDLDRSIAIDGKGLPICHPFRRYVRAGESCRSASVGRGSADFEIAFPEKPPIQAPGHLTLYNGGVKGGVTTLFAVAFLTVPAPSEIVTPIKITKIHAGRYGLRAVAKIAPIAEGNGSLLDFSLKIKRLFTYKGTQESYAMARCPDGHLKAEISSLFRNETKVPGVPSRTELKGTVIRPCTPTA